MITFEPDTAKGNKGPGGGASIVAGKFDTQGRMGAVGGPHRVKIVGFDGIPTRSKSGEELPHGTPLFPPYETTLDLPTEGEATLELDVPQER